MSSTLEGVVRELAEAQQTLAAAQDALISALESRASPADVALLETAVAQATKRRDDLAGTREYIIDHERQRLLRDSKQMSTILYISRWAEEMTPRDIAPLAFQANAQNEVWGITGVLYVLRGWFASYVEGDADALDLLLKRLKADTRHRDMVILERRDNLDPKQRKYPKSGLELVHFDTPQGERQAHPEASMLVHLTHLMALCDFVPSAGWAMKSHLDRIGCDSCEQASLPLAVGGGVGAAGVTTAQGSSYSAVKAQREQRAVAEVALQRQVLSSNGVVVYVTTFGPLWDLPTSRQLEVIELVHSTAVMTIEERTTFCSGFVVTPHDEGMYCVLDGDERSCVERLVLLFDRLRADTKAFFDYCPVITAHHGCINRVINGHCGLVGDEMRVLRLAASVAAQEGIPILLTHAVADEMGREGVDSLGHFLFDGVPEEVFAASATAAVRWQALLKAEEERAAAALSLATHTEGPGPIDDSALRLPRTAHRKHTLTADEFNNKPVRGLITVEELRSQFDALCPSSSDDTIGLDQFNAMYYGQDSYGVDERASEMRDLLTKYAALSADGRDVAPDRVTFEQYCLIMFRREY